MKTIVLILALSGLALGWGSYGQKQIRTGLYDCEVRMDRFCFSWKKNEEGMKHDRVSDHMKGVN